jgi:2-C-methyl-D-erythritol 4-phosphate cytidylyltransferase
MEKTELKLQYEISEKSESGIPVIIVAAGASSRMKGTNKQLTLLGGIPVIIRTLMVFENSKDISNIILVVRDEDLFEIQMLTQKYMITKLSDIVCGGKTRQESVLKGFSRLKESDNAVLIHDGARPLVDSKIISSVVLALENCDAVTCAVKVKDTIKEIDQNGKVIKTLARENLVSVQTPQGVNVAKYLEAVKNVDVANFTDDTSIMEAAGHNVFVVEGSYKNIKITTKEDVNMAEGFLSEEETE